MRLVLLLGATMASMLSAQSAGQTSPDTLIVTFGQLWDGTRIIPNASVVIEGRSIVSVGTGDVQVPDARIQRIDLRRYTAIPGLIDAHTHMMYVWDRAPGTRPLAQGKRDPAVTLKMAAQNGVATLETGVTTVRDLGAGGGLDIALRDAIDRGDIVGPRMFVSGQGISGGRGIATPDDARAITKARLETPADWVKVYASRGSWDSVDTTQTIPFDTLKAIVDTAHLGGRRVAIHSYGPSGVRDAVFAGADSVEHGIDLDDATLKEMARRGTVWVPTIDHNRYYIDAKDDFGFPPESIPPLQAYIEKNLESARRAIKAGVRLAMGSDAVFTMFGQNTRELEWFVKAGMTPEQALRSATATGAALLGVANQLGRIEIGYRADLVAVEGNPLDRIGDLFKGVRWVMKDGVVVVDKTKSRD